MKKLLKKIPNDVFTGLLIAAMVTGLAWLLKADSNPKTYDDGRGEKLKTEIDLVKKKLSKPFIDPKIYDDPNGCRKC